MPETHVAPEEILECEQRGLDGSRKGIGVIHPRVTGANKPTPGGNQAPSLPAVRRLKPPTSGVETESRVLSSPCRPMPRTPTTVAMILAAFLPAPLSGQGMVDLFQALRNGGAWVGIPIEDGVGRVSTATLPTLGMTLRGCGQVYGAHTGRWAIQARDSLGKGRLDVEVRPGEPVKFSYTTGTLSRLTVEARWSEARDTTLLVWIGLETRNPRRPDACVPVYSKGSGTSFPAVGSLAFVPTEATLPKFHPFSPPWRKKAQRPDSSGQLPGDLPDRERNPPDSRRPRR